MWIVQHIWCDDGSEDFSSESFIKYFGWLAMAMGNDGRRHFLSPQALRWAKRSWQRHFLLIRGHKRWFVTFCSSKIIANWHKKGDLGVCIFNFTKPLDNLDTNVTSL